MNFPNEKSGSDVAPISAIITDCYSRYIHRNALSTALRFFKSPKNKVFKTFHRVFNSFLLKMGLQQVYFPI